MGSVKVLLASKANVNHKSPAGSTPLMEVQCVVCGFRCVGVYLSMCTYSFVKQIMWMFVGMCLRFILCKLGDAYSNIPIIYQLVVSAVGVIFLHCGGVWVIGNTVRFVATQTLTSNH